jgi:hypothetical protein
MSVSRYDMMKKFNAHVLHGVVVQPWMNATKPAGSGTRADARRWGRTNTPHVEVRAGYFAIRWKVPSVAELQREQESVEEEKIV